MKELCFCEGTAVDVDILTVIREDPRNQVFATIGIVIAGLNQSVWWQ